MSESGVLRNCSLGRHFFGLDNGVHLREYRILFLGRAELVSEDGRALRAGSHQPLFHVEHSVGGTNTQPLNLWRIVHLTPEKDDALARRQVTAIADVLRRFIAIYVERELGRKLTRR
jgi:hypothetical protein